MIKLKEHFAENFGEVFGYGEINLKLTEKEINYIWIPIGTFINKYLNCPDHKYTRFIAADNLTGIKMYINDNKESPYSFILERKNSVPTLRNEITIFEIIARNLQSYDFSNKEDFIQVLSYFEELYYSSGYCEFSNLSSFISDITDDFHEQIQERIEDLYIELKGILFEEE